jgi:hypothetical protein
MVAQYSDDVNYTLAVQLVGGSTITTYTNDDGERVIVEERGRKAWVGIPLDSGDGLCAWERVESRAKAHEEAVRRMEGVEVVIPAEGF